MTAHGPDLPDLGYIFYPPDYPHCPGHPRLDVLLRPAPTGRHFDPLTLRLSVQLPKERHAILTVRHPWARAGDYHACPGMVSLHDHKGKTVEAFTFGGDLRVGSDEDLTTCTLTSAAPIIQMAPEPLTLGPTVTTLMVEEVTSLIARRRAAWDREHDPNQFEHRLASLDPFTFYCACLESLAQRLERLPGRAINHLARELIHFLHDEIDALRRRGDWPASLPPLERLL